MTDSAPTRTEEIIAGLEANIREAALQLGESARLIRETTENLHAAHASIDRKEAQIAALFSDLENAQLVADGWQKVAEARGIENNRLRRIIMAGDDGVTPE